MRPPPRWTCEPYDVEAAARLVDELGVQWATARILVTRGHSDPDAAREFLEAAERSDPLELAGMEAACEVILRHVSAETPIAVFGDYDVDGVCSTAMMVGVLRALGARPTWRLPSRGEGYGLSKEVVRELAEAGVKLLVTVDCGVGSAEEVVAAHACGVEVVITDHHRAGAALPDCPVVHPGLGAGPDRELCAAGVVLKLSEALRERAGLPAAGAEEDIDLAGLATICDMVPLRGENRRIAREGMVALSRTRRPGLRALMRASGLEPAEVDARTAGFRLGPRLNAAGRLARADAALELVLTEDDERAAQVAEELDRLNRERRDTEQRILWEAEAACASQLHAAAIVVAGEGWHPGVVGIVASRLVEHHHRPCVVIALDGQSGRGSGRSIAPYDLHAGIASAQGHLLGFGGHAMAAGLQIDASRVAAFRAALARHAGECLTPADLIAVEQVDAVAGGGDLTLELAEDLDRLAPFGAANPAPKLVVPGARIEHVTAMGEEGAHARFSLVAGGARARGVAFRTSQASLAACGAAPHDVAVSLERNSWNGRVEPRVLLSSLAPTPPGALRDVGARPFWEELEAELDCDPELWWPEPRPHAAERPRRVQDHRGGGFASLAGDLLTSGGSVVVLVSDVERRRATLESLVAGMAPHALDVLSWSALGADPAFAGAYTHLLALDPPPTEQGLSLLAATPGCGLAHLAWGDAEMRFTEGFWHAELALRPALVELWRALDSGSLSGEQLERALRGRAAFPRSGQVGGRALRVMSDLGLAEVDPVERSAHVVSRESVDLKLSPAFRSYAARLTAVGHYLARERQAAGSPGEVGSSVVRPVAV